jgi:hypothetical protein
MASWSGSPSRGGRSPASWTTARRSKCCGSARTAPRTPIPSFTVGCGSSGERPRQPQQELQAACPWAITPPPSSGHTPSPLREVPQQGRTEPAFPLWGERFFVVLDSARSVFPIGNKWAVRKRSASLLARVFWIFFPIGHKSGVFLLWKPCLRLAERVRWRGIPDREQNGC